MRPFWERGGGNAQKMRSEESCYFIPLHELGQEILIVISMIVLSAFFSGLEIAFLSSNKLRIELKSNQGVHWAKICAGYLRTPSRFISTILVGNNISLVIYGVVMEKILHHTLFEPYMSGTGEALQLFIATVISTFFVITLAEFLPKALFRLNPSGILSVLIYPFQVFALILLPLVRFTLWLAKATLRLILRKEFTEESPSFTKMDLDYYISQGQGSDQESAHDVDTDILKNALEFGNVKVRDCMVPRTELVCIEYGDTVENLEKLFIESGHSKVLIYKDNIDHIIGYVHHVDMFKRPESIQSILIPILITNESKPVNELLNDFTLHRKSIALVVDEFGGTAGIVTTEDIIEEIFGEIEDEHDENDGIIETKISDLEFEFSAKLEIDYLNSTYNLHIPKGEYDTLGGFIMAMHESIPQEGETVNIDHFQFKVLSSQGNRLDAVHLKLQSST